MSPHRQLLLIALVTLALVAMVKMLQVALTPEAWEAVAVALAAIAGNLAVQLLLLGVAVVFLLSLCAASWERSERRYERDRAERAAREYVPDPSSLLDDSPRGPLPDEFRAPCGEPIRFPSTHDRGPRAA